MRCSLVGSHSHRGMLEKEMDGHSVSEYITTKEGFIFWVISVVVYNTNAVAVTLIDHTPTDAAGVCETSTSVSGQQQEQSEITDYHILYSS